MLPHAPLLSRSLDYRRFRTPPYRIILLESGYFTVAECKRGLEKNGHRVFPLMPGGNFIQRLLLLLVEVKPDFLLTINHHGFDEEGKLTAILTELKIPYASWFVDSPTYILYGDARHVSDFCALFSWERSYLPVMEEAGFKGPAFLPLAADPGVFRPISPPAPPRFQADIAFVGNSMAEANEKWRTKVPPATMERISAMAVARQVSGRRRPMAEILGELGENGEGRESLDIEAAMVWKATREYRRELVMNLLPVGLTIYGDEGWKGLLPDGSGFRPLVNYYRELPLVYNFTKVNVNCTSFQMQSAVNQRVFDAAACGGFLLTDHQDDMELFFEPGNDAVCFDSPEGAADLARYYLGHETKRRTIAKAARKRVLAEHTYDRRMATLVSAMAARFGQ